MVLLQMGFTRPADHPAAGELLPHHFTLARRSRRYVSVALSLGSPPLGVTQHPALRSSDFPRTAAPHAITWLAWTSQCTEFARGGTTGGNAPAARSVEVTARAGAPPAR